MDEYDGGAGDYDLRVSEAERRREESAIEKAAFREGVASGRASEAALQLGFDRGYAAVASPAFSLSTLIGIAGTLEILLEKTLGSPAHDAALLASVKERRKALVDAFSQLLGEQGEESCSMLELATERVKALAIACSPTLGEKFGERLRELMSE